MKYIELAQEAEEYAAKNAAGYWKVGPEYHDLFYKKFAELVEAAARADEREECAKLCDDMDSTSDYYGPRVELICAEAIRARGGA
jgi:hypothetical protein